MLKADHQQADALYSQIPTQEHFQMADHMLVRLRHKASRLRPMKAILSYALPNEIVRILLKPKWTYYKHTKYGIGHQSNFNVPPILYWYLRFSFAKLLAARMPPLRWHLATGFTVQKANNLPGIDGERLVVALDPFGRLFYEIAISTPIYKTENELGGEDVASPDNIQFVSAHDKLNFSYLVPNWQFGCIPGRRREGAILAQLALTWELMRNKYYQVLSLYDGRNAFWSLKLDSRKCCQAAVLPH